MSESKDVVDSEIATNDTSSAVVSTKAGEIVAEATPCFTPQENSVQNRENERGDSLITDISGDGDARAPPSSSQNLGLADGSSQPNKANSPVDGFTTSVTDEAPQDEDSSDEAGPAVPTDTTKQHITTPVMDSAEQFVGDITDESDVVVAQNVVAETTNQHNNTCSEESEARRFPDPVAMETTCTSSSDGAVAGASKPDDGGVGGSREHYLYQVKWIHYNGANVGVITQNENGPCPLLAIVNILTLQGKIKLPGTLEVVSSSQLMEYLADCIFEQAPPKGEDRGGQLDYEQNRHDALAVFHKLQTGLDVNVKFSSVADFEYTPECIVFDLLGIRLYHGWLVDPELPDESTAIGSLSYNQLVEKIIMQKNSPRPELVTEALIAEEFLNKTASQLTYCGLCELASTVKEEELCVFFRNNHFSTLYKHKSELFLLVTDQGYLTENKAVWETLGNVEGDGHFVDADFHTYTKPALPPIGQMVSSHSSVNSDQQIDQDYLVALSMQEEHVAPPVNSNPTWHPDYDSDHALAQRLQEEEDGRTAAAGPDMAYQQPDRHASDQARSHLSPGGASPGRGTPVHGGKAPARDRKKDNACSIL